MPQLLLALLVVINCARLFRHAMLRDELQSFMLAAASSRPLDLFAKLKYEGHPGLWHAGSTVNSVIRKARPLNSLSAQRLAIRRYGSCFGQHGTSQSVVTTLQAFSVVTG